ACAMRCTAASPFFTLRPASTTIAPADARPSAMPSPMPPLPPVTIAMRPERSKRFIGFLSYDCLSSDAVSARVMRATQGTNHALEAYHDYSHRHGAGHFRRLRLSHSVAGSENGKDHRRLHLAVHRYLPAPHQDDHRAARVLDAGGRRRAYGRHEVGRS